MSYDAVASAYDSHYAGPVDRWEDRRLASLLAPYTNGKHVLDLGCGTGWVLDHLAPKSYVGVDVSAGMLEQLAEKHIQAIGTDETLVATGAVWPNLIKAEVGAPGWADELPDRTFDTVVATWAASEFPLGSTLHDLRPHLRAGSTVALHGTTPRGLQRSHYILHDLDEDRKVPPFTMAEAQRVNEPWLHYKGSWGTGVTSLPIKPLWHACLGLKPDRHYATLHVWDVW